VLNPVPDLQAFLIGRWRTLRRISDARAGMVGRLTGRAVFTPSADGLIHDESGDLSFGAYQGQAVRRYRLSIDGSSAMVHHADGSLFHGLDLTTGTADILHRCGEDTYRGRYRVLGENRFLVSWQVRGPRKRYRLATSYLRVEA